MTESQTLAEIADDLGMTPGDVVIALNHEAAHWQIAVQRDHSMVKFYVAGEVYPVRTDGTRGKRGKRPFFGPVAADATRALYLGLLALRDAG